MFGGYNDFTVEYVKELITNKMNNVEHLLYFKQGFMMNAF